MEVKQKSGQYNKCIREDWLVSWWSVTTTHRLASKILYSSWLQCVWLGNKIISHSPKTIDFIILKLWRTLILLFCLIFRLFWSMRKMKHSKCLEHLFQRQCGFSLGLSSLLGLVYLPDPCFSLLSSVSPESMAQWTRRHSVLFLTIEKSSCMGRSYFPYCSNEVNISVPRGFAQ